MAQKHTPTIARERECQMITETLHRALQVPETKWGLAHLQDGRSIERRGALAGLL